MNVQLLGYYLSHMSYTSCDRRNNAQSIIESVPYCLELWPVLYKCLVAGVTSRLLLECIA